MRRVLVIPVVFFVGLALGVAVERATAKQDGIYKKLAIFAKVLHYVKTNYVDPVDETQLIHGAIKGMLDTLDPHSVFLPPDLFKELKVDSTGEFSGVGIKLDYLQDKNEQGFVVVSVLPDSPAEKVGIKPGEKLIKVDGKPIANKTLQEVVRMLRGPVGTSVVLTVENDQTGVRDVLVVRAVVRLSSVESRQYNKVGYIAIKVFSSHVSKYVRRSLNSWLSSNPPAVNGVILDLRDNPGGILDEAVSVADLFLSKGIIVSVEGRNPNQKQIERAHKAGTFDKVPVVVLVNGGSASASEVLAGALQDQKRALILGEQTFGKGTVQTIIDLEDGSGIKLTTARYYTPNHRSIHGKGIKPDLLVPDPRYISMDLADALESLPENVRRLVKNPPPSLPKEDWQLVAAYRLLSGA